MAYRLRILTPAEARDFGQMTFPAYRSLLGNGTLAVGAYAGNEPVGLALVSPTRDRSRAELLSLYVNFPQRMHGLGTMLLGHAERVLFQANIPAIYTVWSETMAGAKPLEAVLAKQGWNEPKRRMLVLRGNVAGEFGEGIRKSENGPKYEKPDCLPRQYEFLSWADMNDMDRAFILSKEGQPNWYAPRSNPFREENILDPAMSLVLRKEGEIVGWLASHRTAPDTVRFTDVFIRTDLRRAGAVSIAMVIHGFWLLMKGGVSKLTWAIEGGNEPLVRMCQTRLGGYSDQSWTWGAEKNLA